MELLKKTIEEEWIPELQKEKEEKKQPAARIDGNIEALHWVLTEIDKK